jgi:hypothetical protein
MKEVVAITGKARAGKDTIGNFLVNNYGFIKYSFADAIREIVKTAFVLSDSEVRSETLKEAPLADFPEWSVRKLLQVIGTDLFRKYIHEDIWVYNVAKRIEKNDNSRVVITDVRFPNELDVLDTIPNARVTTIKVTRHGRDGDVGLTGHESESYDLPTKYSISNNVSIESLHTRINHIIQDIKLHI